MKDYVLYGVIDWEDGKQSRWCFKMNLPHVKGQEIESMDGLLGGKNYCQVTLQTVETMIYLTSLYGWWLNCFYCASWIDYYTNL